MATQQTFTRGIKGLVNGASRSPHEAPSSVAFTELAPNLVSENDASRKAYEGKTIKDLPGPPTVPGLGSLWWLRTLITGKISQFHNLQSDLVKKYGSLIRLDMGPQHTAAVGCPKVMEEVYRSQEPVPTRLGPQSWIEYLKDKNLPFGLLTAQNDEWLKLRSEVRPSLLKSNSFETATPFLSEIISDFSDHLAQIADESGYVANLPQQIQHLSHELIVMALFGKRLGCFSTFGDKVEAEKFISSVNDIFGGAIGLLAFAAPLFRRWNSKSWRNHKLAWDRLHKSVIELTKEAVSRQSELEQLGFVPLVFPLLARDGLAPLERVSVIIELLLGGVHTTSNTIGFGLVLLAQNPAKQEKLRQSVTSMLEESGGETPTFQQLQHATYVRNTMKETLRKYPILTINGRSITKPFISPSSGLEFREKDNIVFLNHHICNKSGIFPREDEFIPERFDREGTTADSVERQFVSIPFGFGTRGCIGKKLAELEVCITLSKLVSDYKLIVAEDVEFYPILRGALTPGSQIPVKFQARSS